jgi:hypothetical protein
MERQEAERTLLEVERVRRETRHRLNPVWFGNLAFGLFLLGTAVLDFAGAGGIVVSVYWLVALVLTSVVVGRFYARQEHALGVSTPWFDGSMLILLLMFAGIVAANIFTTELANAVMPLSVAALGIVALGLYLRDRIDVAAGIAVAVVATAIAAIGPEHPGQWGNLGIAVVLVVAGLAGRRWA